MIQRLPQAEIDAAFDRAERHDQVMAELIIRVGLATATTDLAAFWLQQIRGTSPEAVTSHCVVQLDGFNRAWHALAAIENPAATIVAALDGFAEKLDTMDLGDGVALMVRGLVADELIAPIVARLSGAADGFPQQDRPAPASSVEMLRKVEAMLMRWPELDGLAGALDALLRLHVADAGGKRSAATEAAWSAASTSLQLSASRGVPPVDLQWIVDLWATCNPGAPEIIVKLAGLS